jgi:hypothetical protein
MESFPPFSMDNLSTPEGLLALHKALWTPLHQSDDIYKNLNTLRDFVNQHFPDFELYLEDVWNDHQPGETHFEYILRSRKTYNETDVIGFDVYKNHQDANGVWHLDEYVYSKCLMADPSPLVTFIVENL